MINTYTRILFLVNSLVVVSTRKEKAYIGIWMSFTKYPINPITANPTATALQICINSVKC